MLVSKIALILGLLLIAATASVVNAADLSRKGTIELGASIGIGNKFSTSLLGGNVEEDVKFLSLMFSWGKVFKELSRERSFAIAVEGFVSAAEQENEDRYLVGATPLFVYNFRKAKRTNVFTETGVGLLYTDLDPVKFGSHLNFVVQAGVGFRYRLTDDRFFKFSYRFQHISNGGTAEENKGIDSNFLIFGISFLR